MTQVVGFVKEIKVRTGTSKAGKAWTGYTLVMTAVDGTDQGFFSYGFSAPKSVAGVAVKQGDYVQFESVSKDGKYNDVAENTLKIGTPPAAAKAVQAVAATAAPSGDRNKSIQYQAARNAAIELVRVLGDLKALPISQASTKAADAKRFDEVVAIVDKLTVRFHFDVETFRVLENVQDSGDEVDLHAEEETPVLADSDLNEGTEDPGFA